MVGQATRSSKLKPKRDPRALIDKLPAGVKIIGMRLQKWFIASSLIGLVTGLIVAFFDFVLSKLLSFNLSLFSSSTFLTVILLPAFGLGTAGLLLSHFGNGRLFGTEEVIKTFHDPNGRLDPKKAPAKLLASIFTIGFGGSAGLEGPSIYIGAVVSTLSNRLLKLFNLGYENMKSMTIAGGAAGIAAIFKAPLTGIVFGLEVPYKDDFAKESLIPSLVASVTSYLTIATILGVKPLFKTQVSFSIDYYDLIFAGILGFVVGLAGRFFVLAFRRSERFFDSLRLSLAAKMAIGGLLAGLTGLITLLWLGSPASLGVGYETLGRVLNETLTLKVLAGLLALKAFAVIATLAPGGAGGIFIPMIMMGGILGAIVGKFAPLERGHLFPIIGMPAFLAAGYKTPLAAVTFIAETTGSPSYIIPGLIAAAVGYAVSGRISVSQNQRWSRITPLEMLLSTKVSQVMTLDVKTIPASAAATDFFDHYFLNYRHKSMPVVDETGALAGMIAISDINRIPKAKRAALKIKDAAVKEVRTVYPDQSLADALDIMHTHDIDRIPVVDRRQPKKIVGIISSTDIMSVEELTKFWQEHKHTI